MDPPPPPQPPPPPSPTNPRFTLELEFVLSLANPYYLSHLATSFPNLLGTSTVDEKGDETDEAALSSSASGKEARAFQAYLAYLYSYWKTPEYAQFLTHPGATLRALRLLQEESFRRDIIRPQVIESLLATRGDDAQTTTAPENENSVENSIGTQAP